MAERSVNEMKVGEAAQGLAAQIIASDDHWSRASQKLLAGMLSYWLHGALHGQLKAEFLAMASEFANRELPVEKLWETTRGHCPAVAEAVSYMRSLSTEERVSIESTAYRASVAALERFFQSQSRAPAAAVLDTRSI